MPFYYLYILKCADGSLYTGITTDLERRLEEHRTGKRGSKYTAAHRPVELVYKKRFSGRPDASREETRIKKLSRSRKLALIVNKKYYVRLKTTKTRIK